MFSLLRVSGLFGLRLHGSHLQHWCHESNCSGTGSDWMLCRRRFCWYYTHNCGNHRGWIHHYHLIQYDSLIVILIEWADDNDLSLQPCAWTSWTLLRECPIAPLVRLSAPTASISMVRMRSESKLRWSNCSDERSVPEDLRILHWNWNRYKLHHHQSVHPQISRSSLLDH